MPVKRKAPMRAALQWRWVITEREYSKPIPELRLAVDDINATIQAKAHAVDNRVDMRFVTGTGPGDRIGKQDVVDYIAAGKPIPEMTEMRMPRIREIVAEARNAKLLAGHRLKRTLIWLWEDCTIEEIDGKPTPVYIIEWGLTAGRGPASRLKDGDRRFGLVPARANNPWHSYWSPSL